MTKTQAGAALRKRWLKVLFDAGNEGWCEICGGTFGVSQAHRVKRRKMPSFKKDREAWEAEMMVAAYLCQADHERLEQGPPEEMYRVITGIHDNRGK